MKFLTLVFILSTIPLSYAQPVMSGGTGGKGGNGTNDSNLYLVLEPEYVFDPLDCVVSKAYSSSTLSSTCSRLNYEVMTYDQELFYKECCPL